MRLVIEELSKELPQGWVTLRRTPNTDPADGFIEMHFTGDRDLIAENRRLREWIAAVADYLDNSPSASAAVWCEEAYALLEGKEQE